MDLNFADNVLSEAVKRGNNQAELQKHLDTLDAAGQEQFINEAAQAFGISTPDQVIPQRSAKAEFEAGNAGASMVTDEGKRTYANPISPAATASAAVLKGATSLPFVGNVAEKAITSATGQSSEEFQQFEEHAGNQNPWSSALGELIGVAALGPKALEGAGAGVAAGAKATGSALRSLGQMAGSKILGGGAAVSHFLKFNKLGSILADEAVLANTQEVKAAASEATQALHQVGESIGGAVKKVQTALPKEQYLTKAEAWQKLSTTIEQNAKEVGQELPTDLLPKLKRQFDRIVSVADDAPIDPNRMHGFAKLASKESGKYGKASKFSPSAGSRAELLDMIDVELRGNLYDYATQAATINKDASLVKDFAQHADTYKVIKQGTKELFKKLNVVNKKEAADLAAQRTVEVLGKTKMLDKFGPRLLKAVKHGLPAATRLHTNLVSSSDEYRSLLEQAGLLDAPSAEQVQ